MLCSNGVFRGGACFFWRTGPWQKGASVIRPSAHSRAAAAMPCRGRFLRDSQDVPDAVALGGTSATVQAILH